MCVFYRVCDRSGLLSLFFSRYSVPRAQAAHARICVKQRVGVREQCSLHRNIPAQARERETVREGDSTDEPSTHFLSCARGGALPRDSGEHREQSRAPAAKERYVNLRTNINISYINIQMGRVDSQSMLILASWVYRLNIRVICVHIFPSA